MIAATVAHSSFYSLAPVSSAWIPADFPGQLVLFFGPAILHRITAEN